MAPVWALLCQLFIWADNRLCLSLEIILATTSKLGMEGVWLPLVIYEDDTVCL